MADEARKCRLAVAGAAGRMGRMLVKAIAETPGCEVVAALERPGSVAIGEDAGLLAGVGALSVPVSSDVDAGLAGADGLIDFTVPEATRVFAAKTARQRVAHIVGTTGLATEDLEILAEAARETVVVRSGNMSLGVNLLAVLVRRVARALGDDFDIEIVEMHHNRKVDAPSGTALLLGEAAAQGRSVSLDERSVRSRDGITGPRRAGDIGFATLRGGTVVGDHTVVFAGPHERIELRHIAEDRSLFARGAVSAALWARGRPAGLYSMADVLGLTDE